MQDLEFRQLVERVKLRSPIEIIVGERVSELRQKGALFWSRCPFHEERTPSFAVDPRKGTWRCYGACGEGGDVISFIERFDGLPFLDALRLLARMAGEELPERMLARRSRAEDARGEERYEVLRRAARLYQRLFQGDEGRDARAYLRERGLGPTVLEKFGIGWAPRHGSPLLEAATRSGVGTDVLVETGLVRRAEDGRPYDFFRGRLMVPIRDRLGRTVGFGARILPQDEDSERPQGKYVNTPETPLFHKGRLVFGLDLAADAIRRSRHVILVEGYTDVMAAHQAGRENVAAVLGTSTTEEHAGLIRRTGAQRVTLVFDGDEAGRSASRRALPGLLPLGLEIDVVGMPSGTDPCDLLVGEDGADAFERALAAGREWFEWTLAELRGLSGPALATAVDAVFALLLRLSRPVERSARLAEMARALGLPEEDLRTQWRAHEERRGRARALAPAVETRARPATGGAEERAFELVLGALLRDNSLIPLYADLEERCPEGDLQAVFRAILDLRDHAEDDDPIDAGRVMTALADHPARRLVVELDEKARTAESPEVLARDQRRWLERRAKDLEEESLRRELTRTVQTLEGVDAAADVLQDLHAKMRQGRVPGRRRPQPNH